MTRVLPRAAGWEGALPPARSVPAAVVRERLAGARRLVVLDDDPTGTQTVRDVPVLTRWRLDDIRWALRQPAPGFFVLTNTRSLTPGDAAARNREVAEACHTAAREEGVALAFESRSDSTLRGHFPLETDVLGEVIARHGPPADMVLLSPAYVDAGRVTLDGVHWVRTGATLTPVADGEFARDATFGYRSSRLAEWVEEKSGGRIRAGQVATIGLDVLRSGDDTALDAALRPGPGPGHVPPAGDAPGSTPRPASPVHPGDAPDTLRPAPSVHPGDAPETAPRPERPARVVVGDAGAAEDQRAPRRAGRRAEAAGARPIYRVGPSFVRARLGQDASAPLGDARLRALTGRSAHGLIVVGSHVGLTTRQLTRLRETRPLTDVELDVETVLDDTRAERHLRDVAARAAAALTERPVVLSTSRRLVTGADADESLAIARRVSAALTRVTGDIVAARRPSYVVAKGGITSSDIATGALCIDRAWARGSLLPGMVSLWEAASGPAQGLAYVVFAGNVGDDDSLATVVERLEFR
jgi:uncharacterized protein YgbK (DUF1537 family)